MEIADIGVGIGFAVLGQQVPTDHPQLVSPVDEINVWISR